MRSWAKAAPLLELVCLQLELHLLEQVHTIVQASRKGGEMVMQLKLWLKYAGDLFLLRSASLQCLDPGLFTLAVQLELELRVICFCT